MSQKIDSIKFNNYRAFYGEYKEIDLKGKNLLVWGENGSGKSSFCKAIYDLVFKKRSDSHQKNMFSTDNWKVNFKINGTSFEFDSENEIEEDSINNCSLVSPFLNYRQILSLYFAPDSQNNEVKLFQIFEKLLAKFPITEKGGKKLEELKDEPDYIDIFSNLLNETLKDKVLEILNSFNLNFKIEEFVFEENEISLKTSIFGEQITERYNDFLNEARLSALSISIYLAAIKQLSVSQGEEVLDILVLDDMLIGLDMGNRMAVFDIIKNHFANTQVFFFTYDKAWFEVFRDKVDETKWISLEMYAQSVNENGKTFEKPFIREKNDCWMKAVIAEENFDYDNCANLLRKELEKQLDKYLAISDCNLEQKIFLANMKARENKIGELMKALISKIESIKGEATTQPFLGKMTSIESNINDVREAENDKSFSYLKEFKDHHLNPSSHNQILKPIYKQELEKAFDAIVEFMKANNIEIDWPSEREKIIKGMREPVLIDSNTSEQLEILTDDDQERLNNFDQGVEDDFSGNP